MSERKEMNTYKITIDDNGIKLDGKMLIEWAKDKDKKIKELEEECIKNDGYLHIRVENLNNRGLPKLINQICKLKPKNQVVIAKGKVKIHRGKFISIPSIGDNEWANIADVFEKYDNKEIELIIEIKD